jgi:D(-)-tartrate dehydratase
MRIVDIRERTIPISRYADPAIPSGGLDTSVVAIVTDVVRGGKPIVGYGFASIGRFGQGGLIRDRFAPRLRQAAERDLLTQDGATFDPFRAWAVMMRGEKPGGHGERCVAVGTLDMALWDAAAKITGEPLATHLARRVNRNALLRSEVPVYAGGGYPYPRDDLARLAEEMQRFRGMGFTHAKMKIGAAPLGVDLKRIEVASEALGSPARLAVDAMNVYDREACLRAAHELAPLDLWWFEDICDPLDFETHADVAERYPEPLAAGEALFSLAEAKLLHRYAGLRPGRDILLFDPVHCYGLPGYVQIVDYLEGQGWPRSAFWPHGGHLFALHVVAALGLGGAEVNPGIFQPFGGLSDGVMPKSGHASPPTIPGIGFETRSPLHALFETLLVT